jgi:thiol:disulfide interchange protein DsbA
VFETIHKNGNRIFDDKSIAEWASSQGVDARKFADAYNSFGVASKVKRAEQMVEPYKISSVPAMTVDGKYLVTGKDIGGLADLLPLTNRVIDKARGERKKK